MAALNPFGWADSAVTPAPLVASTNVFDTLNRAIDGYIGVRRAEAETDAQIKLARTLASQQALLGAVPQQYNPGAQLVPGAAYAGMFGAPPVGAPMGTDWTQFLILSALAAGAWLLLGR